MLKIFNSLTKKKEIFKSINPGKVTIYVCGPTVYDYIHIGNARTYSAFDVIIRYLRWIGYDVTYVRNITDIDDKIIKRANDNHERFEDVVNQFTRAMHDDFAALQFIVPEHEPRATDYIPKMIEFINQLLLKQHAYVAANGDVYYDVRTFKNYGMLAHRNIDQLESGARVEVNNVKRDPLDFVLWKQAKPGEPNWESPWGAGRPGWHIECSTMSMALLGKEFDIHGGGKDLIFPHHENEMAQSEAITEHKHVNIWMHAGYLQSGKEKMSKSLGNFFTVRDLIKKHSPEVIRYFLTSAHYRSPLQFSDEGFIQARHALERLYNTMVDLPDDSLVTDSDDSEHKNQFIKAMDDDFNTPIALSVLFELAHEVQRSKSRGDITLASKQGALLKSLGRVLGILQENPVQFLRLGVSISAEEIEGFIAARNQARINKDWAEADRIRQELIKKSIILEDGSAGTTWKYLGNKQH